jgi:carbamate kinase
MRILAALGGTALLQRGQHADAAVQLRNVAAAVPALAALAKRHEVIITHGNGPQMGLLALESAADPNLTDPYPLDTLGAETQGMIGYWLARELGNALPEREVVAVLTQTVVDPGDPAFATPSRFVGPVYEEATARRLATQRGWHVRPDANAWRRVVSSPEPREIVELRTIRRLVDSGVLVIAAGGGGVPVTRLPDGTLRGSKASSTRISPPPFSPPHSTPTCCCCSPMSGRCSTTTARRTCVRSGVRPRCRSAIIASRTGRWGRRSRQPAGS